MQRLTTSDISVCGPAIGVTVRESAMYRLALEKRLFGAAAAKFGADAVGQIDKLTSDADSGWISPFHSWWAFVLRSGLPLGFGDPLERISDLVWATRNRPAPLLSLGDSTSPYGYVSWAVRQLQQDSATAQEPDRRLQVSEPEVAKGEVERIRLAHLRIRDVWPEMALEIDHYIREVVVLNEGAFRSGTLNTTFGALFIAPRKSYTWINRADLLIHECSHHSLDVKMSMVSFLENPEEFALSSLRGEARPVRAVLHAAFVLSRVLTGLARIRAAGFEGAVAGCDSLKSEYIHHYHRLRASLNEHGRYTPAGVQMLASMDDMAMGSISGQLA